MAGLDWRSWSAADRAAVVYILLQRANRDDTDELRKLYELVGDTAAVAAIDRDRMGQEPSVPVRDVGVR